MALCLSTAIVNGQEWTMDTVRWGNYHFISELPHDFKRDINIYSEGILVSYMSTDSAFFTIFHGYNAVMSLYRQQEFDTLKIDSNTYSGVINGTEKYWKAMKISEELMWSYSLVNKECLEVFDRIFESFKAEPIRKAGNAK